RLAAQHWREVIALHGDVVSNGPRVPVIQAVRLASLVASSHTVRVPADVLLQAGGHGRDLLGLPEAWIHSDDQALNCRWDWPKNRFWQLEPRCPERRLRSYEVDKVRRDGAILAGEYLHDVGPGVRVQPCGQVSDEVSGLHCVVGVPAPAACPSCQGR